jgi:hypothetical protein
MIYSLFAICKQEIETMILKPQDIVVLLKLVAIEKADWSYAKLAVDLEMSSSEVHAAVKRSLRTQLAIQKNSHILPNIKNLNEFIIHGLRYVFVPDRGEITRGMPTIFAAAPMMDKLISSGDPPPVWPDPDGDVRGQSFSPLYKSVPSAARKDEKLYELLVLIDAIRGGNTRERKIASLEIQKRFDDYNDIQ